MNITSSARYSASRVLHFWCTRQSIVQQPSISRTSGLHQRAVSSSRRAIQDSSRYKSICHRRIIAAALSTDSKTSAGMDKDTNPLLTVRDPRDQSSACEMSGYLWPSVDYIYSCDIEVFKCLSSDLFGSRTLRLSGPFAVL